MVVDKDITGAAALKYGGDRFAVATGKNFQIDNHLLRIGTPDAENFVAGGFENFLSQLCLRICRNIFIHNRRALYRCWPDVESLSSEDVIRVCFICRWILEMVRPGHYIRFEFAKMQYVRSWINS